MLYLNTRLEAPSRLPPPPYIDRACFMVIWFLSFDVKPLLLLEKFKAISQGGVLNRLNGNQNSEGERTYVLNQPPTFKVDS